MGEERGLEKEVEARIEVGDSGWSTQAGQEAGRRVCRARKGGNPRRATRKEDGTERRVKCGSREDKNTSNFPPPSPFTRSATARP